MDCIHDFEICNCECHNPSMLGNMIHCMPCCGTCPYCQKHINFLYYDEHVSRCNQTEPSLECTSDGELCDCIYHQYPDHYLPSCCKVCPHCECHIKVIHFAEHLQRCETNKPKK